MTPSLLWALTVTGADVAPLLASAPTESAADVAQLLWCQATARAPGAALLEASTERLKELSSLDVSRCAWAAAVLQERRREPSPLCVYDQL